jgi:glycogen debranching enzyme
LLYYASQIYLTNPTISSQTGEIPKGALSLTIARTVEEGIHEDLDITNHSLESVTFNLDFDITSDFADIFEVESGEFVRRGQIETEWDKEEYKLRNTYKNGEFYRCTIAHWNHLTSPPHYANGRVTFEIELEAGASWHACCCYTLIDNEHCHDPISLCYQESIKSDVNTKLQKLQRQWQDVCTPIATSNEDVKRLYQQSLEDMSAMRLYDYDLAPDVWLPAAGVPKYVALFGRDSLTASLQNEIIHPGFARGALQKLGQFQAKEYSDWQDAEPGKILHELRHGVSLLEKKSAIALLWCSRYHPPLYNRPPRNLEMVRR